LAQVLRVQHLPGEMVEIQLIQPGANREQAVGYLDDGTMVVVESSRHQIGQKVRVEIVRSLQTEAGRMMFAKKVGSSQHDNRHDNAAHTASKPKPKIATVFHSDQLTKQKSHSSPRRFKPRQQPAKPTAETTNRAPKVVNKPRSAEDSMVALANGANNAHKN
jgi:hypothetical protein